MLVFPVVKSMVTRGGLPRDPRRVEAGLTGPDAGLRGVEAVSLGGLTYRGYLELCRQALPSAPAVDVDEFGRIALSRFNVMVDRDTRGELKRGLSGILVQARKAEVECVVAEGFSGKPAAQFLRHGWEYMFSDEPPRLFSLGDVLVDKQGVVHVEGEDDMLGNPRVAALADGRGVKAVAARVRERFPDLMGYSSKSVLFMTDFVNKGRTFKALERVFTELGFTNIHFATLVLNDDQYNRAPTRQYRTDVELWMGSRVSKDHHIETPTIPWLHLRSELYNELKKPEGERDNSLVVRNRDLIRQVSHELRLVASELELTKPERTRVKAVQEAVKARNTDGVRKYLWDDCPAVRATAISSLAKTVQAPATEADEFGRISLQGTVYASIQEDLERLVKYARPEDAALAFSELTIINREVMEDAMMKSLGDRIDDQTRDRIRETVDVVLTANPDEHPEAFQQVADALEHKFGRLVTVSDLQLKGDELELSRKIPLALTSRGFNAQDFVRAWAARFSRIQDDYPATNEPLLTVYGSCIDRTYGLNQSNVQEFMDRGVKAVAEKEHGGVIEDAAEAILAVVDAEAAPKKVSTATEFMGVLVRRMNQPGDDKTSVTSRELDLWIDETFGGLNPVDKSGGASANIAVNLPREPQVVLAVEHNHPELGKTFPDRIKRFSPTVAENGVESLQSLSEATGDDPTQINHPMEFDEGLEFTLGDRNLRSIDNGRMIYGSAGVYKGDVKHDKPSSYILGADGKPLQDPEALRAIGSRFRKVIFNGIHYVKDPEALRTQINGVKAGGAVTHAELSGIKSDDLESLRYLDSVLKGSIDSIAFNDDETVTVLRALKYFGEDVKVDEGRGPEATLANGLEIARTLGLSRLHIHGQHNDLILRRNADEKDMQSEVVGGMWQKYQIYKKLTGEKLTGDVAANMKLKGLEALMQSAARYTAGMTQDTITELTGQRIIEPARADQAAAQIIQTLTMNGYIHNPTEGGYSIALLPPKWIYGDRKIYPTGAGDTASGNQFNYSGMHTRIEDRDSWYEKAQIETYF